MFCPKCGVLNEDGTSFCSSCGETLVDPQAAPSQQAETASDAGAADAAGTGAAAAAGATAAAGAAGVAGTSAAAATAAAGTAGAVSTASSNPGSSASSESSGPSGSTQGGFAAQPVAQQGFQQQIYTESCTAAAWKDVTGTSDWLTKALLMALIGLVPILNWVNDGFLLRWSSKLSLGRREPMPKNLFDDNTFIIGVYNFVIALAIGIVAWILSLLNIIPVLGSLIVIAASLLLGVFGELMAMRAAIANKLEAGFDLKDIWKVMQRGIGPILFAIIVPELIAMAIVFFVILIFALIAFAIIGLSLSGYYATDPTFALGMILTYGGVPIVFLMIIAMFICSVVYVVMNMVITRAVGHWVARFAPEWANLAVPAAFPPSGFANTEGPAGV